MAELPALVYTLPEAIQSSQQQLEAVYEEAQAMASEQINCGGARFDEGREIFCAPVDRERMASLEREFVAAGQRLVSLMDAEGARVHAYKAAIKKRAPLLQHGTTARNPPCCRSPRIFWSGF